MSHYRGDGKLDALTLYVIHNSTSATFHAPTSEGDALCGVPTNGRGGAVSTC